LPFRFVCGIFHMSQILPHQGEAGTWVAPRAAGSRPREVVPWEPTDSGPYGQDSRSGRRQRCFWSAPPWPARRTARKAAARRREVELAAASHPGPGRRSAPDPAESAAQPSRPHAPRAIGQPNRALVRVRDRDRTWAAARDPVHASVIEARPGRERARRPARGYDSPSPDAATSREAPSGVVTGPARIRVLDLVPGR